MYKYDAWHRSLEEYDEQDFRWTKFNKDRDLAAITETITLKKLSSSLEAEKVYKELDQNKSTVSNIN